LASFIDVAQRRGPGRLRVHTRIRLRIMSALFGSYLVASTPIAAA
jgi:hypothetical protein